MAWPASPPPVQASCLVDTVHGVFPVHQQPCQVGAVFPTHDAETGSERRRLVRGGRGLELVFSGSSTAFQIGLISATGWV